MTSRERSPFVAAILTALLAVAACSDDSVSTSGGGADTGDAGGATVAFVSPSAGEVFDATADTVDIVAELNVLGLSLAEGGPYLSLLLDGTEVGTVAGTERTFTFSAVPIGEHTLGVQAMRGAGEPYEGSEYADEVTIEVRAKAAECASDSDCADQAEGVCRPATCDVDAGECRVVDAATTTACDDGDACTDDDHCDGGTCQGGKPVACKDDNPCTDDSCDPLTGCVITNNTEPCDDGDPCTDGDACEDGACASGADICGECDVDADCADKEDGDLCNGTLRCTDGSCEVDPATVVTCTAASACSSSTCDAATGECVESPVTNGTACDDGNACTTGDACVDGACTPAGVVDCDDGDACTTEACDEATGECVVAPGLPCDDDDLCTTDSCDPATGECVFAPTTSCDDGDACTADSCDPATGACAFVADVVCDDDNVCTTDSCDPASGECAFANNTEPCDDGAACTVGDVCADGACTAGAPKPCDDENLCTTDACTPATGDCSHTPNTLTCDDGNACTTNDKCSNGTCTGGPAKSCDDANPCTDDACDSGSGVCSSTPNTAPCNDGDVCTLNDACQAGACKPGPIAPSCALPPESICAVAGPAGTTIDCPIAMARFDADTALPGTLAFTVTYDATAAKAVGFSDEICIGATCLPAPVPPNKLSPSGHLAGLTPQSSANWNGSIQVVLNNPTDPAAPITEAYLAGGAVSGDPVFIMLHVTTLVNVDVADPIFVSVSNLTAWNVGGDTMNAWVQDSLIVAASEDRCIPAAEVLCDDGNQCNGTETCDGATSTCMPGVPADCGDGVLDEACGEVCDDGDEESGDGCNATCTSDESCGNGFQDPDEACDDGNEESGDGCNADCTSDETCGNGFQDPDEECDDGNDEPGDGCSPDCVIEGNECVVDADCDDDSVCTGDETCVAGACIPGTPLECSDGVACTVDSCDAVTGCASTPDNESCEDGNGCTDDVCDPVSGCAQFVAAPGSPCEDGDMCTTGDTCLGVTCQAGTTVDCNDGLACTVDSCSTDGTCQHLADNAACEDGNPCTANACDASDGCFEIPLTELPCNDGDPCTLTDACQDGVCVGGGHNPGCGAPPGYVCELWGATDATVDCTVRVARETEADPAATGIEFAVTYDPAVLTLDNFYDDLCFEGFGCFEVAATGTGSTPLSTGHSVAIAPTKVENWGGQGAVVIVNTSDPTVPLSDAWLDGGGEVSGEASIVRLKFKLLQDIPEASPATVELSELVSSDADAFTLVSEIIDAIIVTWAQ